VVPIVGPEKLTNSGVKENSLIKKAKTKTAPAIKIIFLGINFILIFEYNKNKDPPIGGSLSTR